MLTFGQFFHIQHRAWFGLGFVYICVCSRFFTGSLFRSLPLFLTGKNAPLSFFVMLSAFRMAQQSQVGLMEPSPSYIYTLKEYKHIIL